MGFPGGSAGKESASNARDPGLIPELGRSPEEGNDYTLQFSGLENSLDCIVHGVPKSWTRPSDFHFLFAHPGNFLKRSIVSHTKFCNGLTLFTFN